ncbi:sensor histidine kinase, partial [Spirochaetota bacterium]
PIETEKTSFGEVYELINGIVEELDWLAKINGHNIIVSEICSDYNKRFININREYFQKAMSEVLVNSMKFSEADTDILIILSADDDKYEISVINKPNSLSKDIIGIPAEYENLIFEPFYRINNFVFEDYKTLDFGLGLTLVKQIINKQGGDISMFNITDSLGSKDTPESRVSCKISYPLDQ